MLLDCVLVCPVACNHHPLGWKTNLPNPMFPPVYLDLCLHIEEEAPRMRREKLNILKTEIKLSVVHHSSPYIISMRFLLSSLTIDACFELGGLE